ncbi:MAG: 16S rRNA (cytosine(967)-C(5))-methyltransferase RsmB [Candidatus Berkiella sp.]
MKKQNLRALSCLLLQQIIKDKKTFSTDTISQQYPKLSPSDHNFTASLIFGVLRWFYLLEHIIDSAMEKPLKEKDFDIKLLLLIGAYQLYFLNTPPHAAVNECVSACQTLRKIWAKGLVNALLNKLSKQPLEIEAYPIPIRTAHPLWLMKTLKKDWGDRYINILEQNNQRAPLSIRVNQRKISRTEYSKLLTEAHIEMNPVANSSVALHLPENTKVSTLPGFKEGLFSVQDASAQWAAELLDIAPNQTILDACSAPGGKTTHILEKAPGPITLFSVERNKYKIALLEENLARLQLQCTLINADASDLSQYWQTPVFDRILLDPPCSGTGVIRRHPDIKLLRQAQDIAELEQQQAQLLHALWPLLKPNGILLYSTCSILMSENEEQIAKFFNSNTDAIACPIEADWGIKLPYGRQILPGEANMDGFYYAKIKKAG